MFQEKSSETFYSCPMCFAKLADDPDGRQVDHSRFEETRLERRNETGRRVPETGQARVGQQGCRKGQKEVTQVVQ